MQEPKLVFCPGITNLMMNLKKLEFRQQVVRFIELKLLRRLQQTQGTKISTFKDLLEYSPEDYPFQRHLETLRPSVLDMVETQT